MTLPARATRELRSHLPAPGTAVRMEDFPLASIVHEVAGSAWLQQWDLPAGRENRLLLLTHAGCRVIFGAHDARLHGPRRRATFISRRGSGWKVGVRFLPGATPLLTQLAPGRLVDRDIDCPDSPADAIREALETRGSDTRALTDVLETWLRWLSENLDETDLLVNRICRMAETDPEIQSVHSLAERFGMDTRSLRRLVREYTGLHPHWLIERRRLQRALAILHDEPDIPLAALAVDLGYSDQAHFSHRFRQAIGLTPGKLRRAWTK